MSTSESQSGIVLELAEEFLDRYRAGQRPPLKEYIDRHPELAAEIREVFPAMAMMERIALADESMGDDTTRPAPPAKAPSLERLGDYRILREVGRGGMGVVYEAEQLSLGRNVALKLLPPQLLRDAKQRHRFEREARSAAKLHHTNIVPVFGVGEHDGTPYYVMQFIQGLGLDEILDELKRMRAGSPPPASTIALTERNRPRQDFTATDIARSLMAGRLDTNGVKEGTDTLPESGTTVDSSGTRSGSGRLADSSSFSSSSISLLGDRRRTDRRRSKAMKPTYWQGVARVGLQVADALEYAHKQGVLHRDIKPSNLLLDTRGTVWVTDFGLAKASDQPNLTHTGDVLGTLRYMPPEAFAGRFDARGDVYSLGLTLYELLAFRPAFGEKDRGRLVRQVTTEAPERLGKRNPEVPRDLETIVHKAIEREPAHRYATAAELAADLQRYLDDEPIQARRTTSVEQLLRWSRRNPAIAALGGTLAGVLIAVAAVSLGAAGSMSRLARQQTLAALDAELARRHEADQRALAEEARRQAQASAAEADSQRRRAEANFAKARAAVDESFTKISESQLLMYPGVQPLRRELLQSALAFYEGFLKERGDDPAVRAGLASAFLRVGKIRSEFGENREARKSFEKARALFEPLATAAPEDLESADGLAMSLFHLGRNEEAIAIWKRLVRPGKPRFQRELADAFDSQGYRGDLDKRLDAYEQSLAIREMLVGLTPDDPMARRDLAGSLNNIGSLMASIGQIEQALGLFRRAAEQAERAFSLAAQDLQFGRFLTTALNNCAGAEAAVGRPDEATQTNRHVIEVWKTMARENPAIPWVRIGLVDAYDTLIHLLRSQDHADEAGATILLAREGIEKLPRNGAEDLFSLAYARAMSTTWSSGKDPDKSNYVERAEQSREADLAMDALRQAADAGFRDYPRLTNSGYPEIIKERADFKALVMSLKALSPLSAVATSADAGEVVARHRPPVSAGLERSAQAQENQAAARHAIGLILLDLGKLDEAAEHLELALSVRRQLVEGDPESLAYQMDLAATLIGLARLDQQTGRPERAREWWGKAVPLLAWAVEQRPDDRQAWKELGTTHAELGETEEAAKAFAKLMELTPEPQRAATLIGLARQAEKFGRPERAREWWGKAVPLLAWAVEQRPNDQQAWRELGLAHAELGRAEEAVNAFTRLMELTPETGDGSLWWSPDPAGIGDALAGHDEIFGRLVQARPRDLTLLIARHHYFARRRRWREAAEMTARIIEIDPQDEQARRYRRALLLFIGDVEGYGRATRDDLAALKHSHAKVNGWFQFVAKVEYPPDMSPPLGEAGDPLSNGVTAYRDGRYAVAIHLLERVVDSLSHRFRVSMSHIFLAMAHQGLGQAAEARRELDAAREVAKWLGQPETTTDSRREVLLGYGWSEWLIATIALNEAEALIVFDPIFPADPFAQ